MCRALAAGLVRAPTRVRVQGVSVNGALLDDFVVLAVPRQVRVLKPPSSAATSAPGIAEYFVDRLTEVTLGW